MNALLAPETTDLNGLTVLLTAGPTQEAIDPVRYISNHSTGKMGYAIADVLAEWGATVTLVSGPTTLKAGHPAVRVVPVVSAAQMHAACQAYFPTATLTILAAAVADYTPKVVADRKLKKKAEFSIELVRTVDIAARLGHQKRPDQFLVGFALETDNEQANAEAKLVSKNLDLIVLNSLRHAGAGFGHDTNQVSLLDRVGTVRELPLNTKRAIAESLVRHIAGSLVA
ncbi:phosphopantothenoylcysteine decarboxylase domain-containing protein [Fibrella arboris]|uniref:phosphopantothenoylcysteine decarboxylase domain-containing protein n=1 Tax=Fibrella arboris TaxID=3242486 RepID=UPI00351FDDB2